MSLSVWYLVALVCLIVHSEFVQSELAPFENNTDSYPSEIPVYHVRRDVYTNEEVTTGRIDLIGGVNPQEVSVDYFRRALQCRTKRQYIRESRGIWNFIKNINPTADLVKAICAWAELPYGTINNWKVLHDKAKELQQEPPKAFPPAAVSSPFQVRLYRVINGTLHRDWPWGIQRFLDTGTHATEAFVPMLVLDKIGKHLEGAVYFAGQEMSVAAMRFPFPIFSNSPYMLHGDLPLPWHYEAHMEVEIYLRHKREGVSLQKKYEISRSVPWEEKLTKACFYGTTHYMRQYILDVAIMRPDLMDAGWTRVADDLIPWDPRSEDGPQSRDMYSRQREESMKRNDPIETRPGFGSSYYPYKLDSSVHYIHKYKYIVVINGLNGRATADRLASMLAYSGAVVLLQETPYYYHFSYHLKPWIHYVPLAYNYADVIEKIEWLMEHEDLAKQIVANAQAFAKSHLRLEDYYCYVANALEVIADHTRGTSATETFYPHQMSKESI